MQCKKTAFRRLTLIETGNYINRTEKYCHYCDQVLPFSEFFINNSSPDKHQYGCFLCTKFLNNQRCTVSSVLRYGGNKSESTLEILGLDDKNILKFLIWKNPLATEDNWNSFQIDHIRPCHSFKNMIRMNWNLVFIGEICNFYLLTLIIQKILNIFKT